jgi:hypothetical protein
MTERGRSKLTITIEAATLAAVLAAWVTVKEDIAALKRTREDLPSLIASQVAEKITEQNLVTRSEWLTDKSDQDQRQSDLVASVTSLRGEIRFVDQHQRHLLGVVENYQGFKKETTK